jgi:hypothetical protein
MNSLRFMAVIHALFAGAQLMFGALFAHAAQRVAIPVGAWTLRLEGGAMVAMSALLLSAAFGMARLRPWTIQIATWYAFATIAWAAAAIVTNLILRATGAFDVPSNLFGLLVILVLHAVALLYDVTREATRAVLKPGA